MADIFEQMKQGAELLILMDLVAGASIPFTLEHDGQIQGSWRWQSRDAVYIAYGDSPLEVMRTALRMIAMDRDREPRD